MPDLLESFEAAQSTFGTDSETGAIRRVYEEIAPANFSTDVLTVRPDDLAVLRLENVEWSDLGEPARVRAVLARQDLKSKPARREEERRQLAPMRLSVSYCNGFYNALDTTEVLFPPLDYSLDRPGCGIRYLRFLQEAGGLASNRTRTRCAAAR